MRKHKPKLFQEGISEFRRLTLYDHQGKLFYSFLLKYENIIDGTLVDWHIESVDFELRGSKATLSEALSGTPSM